LSCTQRKKFPRHHCPNTKPSDRSRIDRAIGYFNDAEDQFGFGFKDGDRRYHILVPMESSVILPDKTRYRVLEDAYTFFESPQQNHITINRNGKREWIDIPYVLIDEY
jgi:hypothetical protein